MEQIAAGRYRKEGETGSEREERLASTEPLAFESQPTHCWRAVDQHGAILEILVQSQGNKAAARKFFHTLLKGLQDVPRVIITGRFAQTRPATELPNGRSKIARVYNESG